MWQHSVNQGKDHTSVHCTISFNYFIGLNFFFFQNTVLRKSLLTSEPHPRYPDFIVCGEVAFFFFKAPHTILILN